jgi:ubiquinone/menaquinone biosynthesis C-methylase UbiE
MSLSTRALWMLDRWFPPDPSARMQADEVAVHEIAKAPRTMGKYLAELGRRDADVLDFGCGWGGETLWLADHVRSCVGSDVELKSLTTANRLLEERGVTNCRFVHAAGGVLPLPDNSFDAVFSTNTFEHVMDLDQAFSEIYRVLRPGGSFLTVFGPLFYSPFGYHLYWGCAVPYAHLIFGLQPIMALRNARATAPMTAQTWQDMGLNGRRFGEFRDAATRAGFETVRFEAIAVKNLRRLARIPRLGDLFVFGIDAHLRKPRG